MFISCSSQQDALTHCLVIRAYALGLLSSTGQISEVGTNAIGTVCKIKIQAFDKAHIRANRKLISRWQVWPHAFSLCSEVIFSCERRTPPNAIRQIERTVSMVSLSNVTAGLVCWSRQPHTDVRPSELKAPHRFSLAIHFLKYVHLSNDSLKPVHCQICLYYLAIQLSVVAILWARVFTRVKFSLCHLISDHHSTKILRANSVYVFCKTLTIWVYF